MCRSCPRKLPPGPRRASAGAPRTPAQACTPPAPLQYHASHHLLAFKKKVVTSAGSKLSRRLLGGTGNSSGIRRVGLRSSCVTPLCPPPQYLHGSPSPLLPPHPHIPAEAPAQPSKPERQACSHHPGSASPPFPHLPQGPPPQGTEVFGHALGLVPINGGLSRCTRAARALRRARGMQPGMGLVGVEGKLGQR